MHLMITLGEADIKSTVCKAVPGLQPDHVRIHYAQVVDGKLVPVPGPVQIVIEADLVPLEKKNG